MTERGTPSVLVALPADVAAWISNDPQALELITDLMLYCMHTGEFLTIAALVDDKCFDEAERELKALVDKIGERHPKLAEMRNELEAARSTR